MNPQRKRRLVSSALGVAALLQAVGGIFVSAGCMCDFSSRRVGLLLAFGMSAYVVTTVLIAGWARINPLASSTVALALYAAFLGVMRLPAIFPARWAWFAQLPAAPVLVFAFMVALDYNRDVRRARRARAPG